MATTLYYFSGTGNSLKIARGLACKLNGVNIKSISAIDHSNDIVVSDDIIGLIFPIYFLDIPKIVKQFMMKIKVSPNTYIFAFVTFGGNPGNSLSNAEAILKKNKITLNAGFSALMPDNSIILTTSPAEQKRRFNLLEKQINEVAEIVNGKQRLQIPKKNWTLNKLLKPLTLVAFYGVFGIKNKGCDPAKCTRCYACVDICQGKAIKEIGGHLVWGPECVDCFACIHKCPQKAVRFGRIKIGKTGQYHSE